MGRTFRDGAPADWWGLEVITGPYGPHKQHRAIVATIDPVTLPVTSTMYLITNLPHPDHAAGHGSGLLPATLEEIVWLYGLRMWIEESDKQVKHVLGWSAYQVRSDRAIRRALAIGLVRLCFLVAPSARRGSGSSPSGERILPDGRAGRKKAWRISSSSAGLLERGAAGGAGLVGTLGGAATILARLGRVRPHRPHSSICLTGWDKGTLCSLMSHRDPSSTNYR